VFEQHVERRLAAILAADVAGYSRLTGADEEGTITRLRMLRQDVIDPTISTHHGHMVKTTGDGMLVEFASVVDAVRCAVELQRQMIDRNVGVAPNKKISFRIGINLGDVVVESDGDLMGDGVNVAARLENIAPPGSICLSGAAYDQVKGKIAVARLGQTTPKKHRRASAGVYGRSGQLTATVAREVKCPINDSGRSPRFRRHRRRYLVPARSPRRYIIVRPVLKNRSVT
jgi:class 3 adenylate cyclase